MGDGLFLRNQHYILKDPTSIDHRPWTRHSQLMPAPLFPKRRVMLGCIRYCCRRRTDFGASEMDKTPETPETVVMLCALSCQPAWHILAVTRSWFQTCSDHGWPKWHVIHMACLPEGISRGIEILSSLSVVVCALSTIQSQALHCYKLGQHGSWWEACPTGSWRITNLHCCLMMFRSSSSVQKQPGHLSIGLRELGAHWLMPVFFREKMDILKQHFHYSIHVWSCIYI